MYLCMYVCMYIYIYTHMHYLQRERERHSWNHAHARTFPHMHTHTHTHTCTHTRIHACTQPRTVFVQLLASTVDKLHAGMIRKIMNIFAWARSRCVHVAMCAWLVHDPSLCWCRRAAREVEDVHYPGCVRKYVCKRACNILRMCVSTLK